MSSVVLDASAILALLLNEPGAAKVAAAVGDAAVTTVNLAEAVGYFARSGLSEAEIRDLQGNRFRLTSRSGE